MATQQTGGTAQDPVDVDGADSSEEEAPRRHRLKQRKKPASAEDDDDFVPNGEGGESEEGDEEDSEMEEEEEGVERYGVTGEVDQDWLSSLPKEDQLKVIDEVLLTPTPTAL